VVAKHPAPKDADVDPYMMKRLSILFSLLTLNVLAIAQAEITRYQSFTIDQREVVWAQVYHNEESADSLSYKLFNHLKRKSWVRQVQYDGNDIVAELVNYRPDYKRYGGKFRNTSTVIRTGKWDGKVRISFKEGKYRVILESLHYEATQSATGSGKATIEQHGISGTLTEFVLNNYRTAFQKNRLKNLDILQLSFKDSFTLTRDQLIDTDW
jgi:hypothetical protein